MQLIRRTLNCLLLLASAGFAYPCYYGTHAFKPTDDDQSEIESLLYDRYEDPTPEFFRTELPRLKKEVDAKPGDLDLQDEYGMALFRGGKAAEAEAVWRSILQKEPNRFTTLANFATAAHLRGKLEEAYSLLQKAVAAKPGVRNNAEEWHLRMIDYEIKRRRNAAFARDHLFIDELTPVWKNHTAPSKDFSDVKLPVEPFQGVEELLRQFPNYGDGWLVAGLLLDHDEEYHLAMLAYERAAKHGTAQSQQLPPFLAKYKKFEDQGSKIRAAGRGMLTLIIIIVGFFLFRWIGGLVMAIRQDRIEAKKLKEAVEKEQAEKVKKGLKK